MRTYLLLVLLLGCGRTEPWPDGTDFVSTVTGLRGLWTSPNDAEAPKGSCAVADNVMFDRAGILEPCRGGQLLQASTIGGALNRLVAFQGSIIAHYGSGTLSRWTGSAWSNYSGTYSPPDSSTKVRLWEQANSLFALTSAGTYQLDSPAGTWRLTGSPPALQGTATLRRTSDETGAFTANGQWAYRLVWGFNDANRRLQLGAPSGRFLLTSPANFLAAKANIDKPTGGVKTVRVQNTTHGLATGEYIDVTLGGAEANYTAGRFQVTVVSATQFTYVDTGANGIIGNPTNDITYGFASRNADIAAPIPSGVTTSHFLQVYRSAESADANSEPSDALGLVYERAPTNLEIAAGTMTVKDIAPDALRGAELYTSLGSLLDAKNRPPLARDAALFKDCAFYANAAQLHALELQLLAVGGASGLQSGDGVVFFDHPEDPVNLTWEVVLAGAGTENLAAGQFKVYSAGSASQNIADTAKSMVRAINAVSGNTTLYAEYASGDSEAPGRIRLYGRSVSTGAFSGFIQPGTAVVAPFAPQIPYIINVQNFQRASNVVTVNTLAAHGFATGQQVQLISSDNPTHFPTGTKTITSTATSTRFTYGENAADFGPYTPGFAEFLSQPASVVQSYNTAVTNSLMWSAPGEPWAVPATNIAFVGKDSSTLLRVVPTRDRLLLLTDSGFYQLTGSYPNFAIREFDLTLRLKAYDTAVSAGGKVYALTDQGLVEMVESARIVSGPIDKDIRDLLAAAASDVAARAFSVAYDSERKVLFYLPTGAGVTEAQQAYVLHTDTGDWTRLDYATPVLKPTCGIVNPADDLLYFGGSDGFVVKERKARTGLTDQQYPNTGYATGTGPSGTIASISGQTLTVSGLGAQFFVVGATLTDLGTGDVLISAYDAATGRITVTGSLVGWFVNDTVITSAQGIVSVIEPVAQTLGDSGAQTFWYEGSLAFRDSRFSAGSLLFATDLTPSLGAATTLVPPGAPTSAPTEIDFWVPATYRRGARLRMRFTHSIGLERYALQGFTLRGRIGSQRTSR